MFDPSRIYFYWLIGSLIVSALWAYRFARPRYRARVDAEMLAQHPVLDPRHHVAAPEAVRDAA